MVLPRIYFSDRSGTNLKEGGAGGGEARRQEAPIDLSMQEFNPYGYNIVGPSFSNLQHRYIYLG